MTFNVLLYIYDCHSSHAHKATVMDVKWNGNGNWLATASRDHLIKLFDIRTMKELWVLKGHKKDVNSMLIIPLLINSEVRWGSSIRGYFRKFKPFSGTVVD